MLLGCEEQLLPSWRSLASPDPGRLEEERRLFYVAATRAKDRLLITHAAERGRRPTGGPSRFLAEAGLHGATRSPPERQRTPAGPRAGATRRGHARPRRQ